MKILYFTDTHIRGNNPSNRLDNFTESLLDKFKEIKTIINKEAIDFVLHGGDLFDRPDISISVINKFIKIMESYEKPIYLISGNHDVYGHNPATIKRTIMSLLDTVGTIKLINKDEYEILTKDNIKVQLTGQPYVYDIDGEDKLKHYSPEYILDEVDYSIHMVHGMLLDKPFIKGVKHTIIDDIVDTKADIILSGHYHSGFGLKEIDNKYFINPGSLVRIMNTMSEIKRKPRVLVIDINKEDLNFKFINLKNIKEGQLVLDREKLETANFKNERILEFKQIIDSSMNFDKLDINDVLLEVSTLVGVEENVKKEALNRIAKVQMKDLGV